MRMATFGSAATHELSARARSRRRVRPGWETIMLSGRWRREGGDRRLGPRMAEPVFLKGGARKRGGTRHGTAGVPAATGSSLMGRFIVTDPPYRPAFFACCLHAAGLVPLLAASSELAGF